MAPVNCSRCGAQMEQQQLDSGDATLIDGQPYCDPCSDVMFGILDPSQAPQAIADQEDTLEDVMPDADLVESNENYDTSEVGSIEDMELQEITDVGDVEMIDTSVETVTVDMDNLDSDEDFESLDTVDVNLGDDEPGELSSAEEFNPADTVSDHVDFNGLEVTENFADASAEEDEQAMLDEDPEDLPDYLDSEVDYETQEPILEETRDDEIKVKKQEEKKKKISEGKMVKPARTKKGVKKELTPEEKEERARKRQARMEAARAKAQKKKKFMTKLLIGACVVIVAAGGWIAFKSKKENRTIVEKEVNFDTDKKLLGLYDQFEKSFAQWENEKQDRQAKALEAKKIYLEMRDYVFWWQEELEKQGKLNSKIEAHMGKRMQNYQEQYRQVKAYLSSIQNQ